MEVNQRPEGQAQRRKINPLWPVAIAFLVLAALLAAVFCVRAVNQPRVYEPDQKTLEAWAEIAMPDPKQGAYIFLPAKEGEANTAISGQKIDKDGNNLVGNLPELSVLGGFYASQNDWLFYADWTRNGHLYAVSRDGKTEYALTDFPVANLNAVGDTLLFTDTSASVVHGYGESYDLQGLRPVYGGGLYRITGLRSLADKAPGAPQRFGGQQDYYRVTMNAEGVYALTDDAQDGAAGMDWSFVRVEKKGSTPVMELKEGYRVVDLMPRGTLLYLELESDSGWGEINCYDVVSGDFRYDLAGRDMSCYGSRIFFVSNRDQYLYELEDGKTLPQSVSTCPIYSYGLADDGTIEALCKNKTGRVQMTLTEHSANRPEFSGTAYRSGNWYSYFYKPDQDISKLSFPADSPQKDTPVSPDAAVDLLLSAVQGKKAGKESLTSYNAVEEAAFEKRYGELFDIPGSFEKGLSSSMNSDKAFSGGDWLMIQKALKEFFGRISWKAETTYQSESYATVGVTVKNCINLNKDFGNISQLFTQELQRLIYVEPDREALMWQVANLLADTIRQAKPQNMPGYSVEIALRRDDILGWVVADTDALSPLLSALYYYDGQVGHIPAFWLPDRPKELQRWTLALDIPQEIGIGAKSLSLLKALLKMEEPQYSLIGEPEPGLSLAQRKVLASKAIPAAFPGGGICRQEFEFSWLSGPKDFFTAAQKLLA